MSIKFIIIKKTLEKSIISFNILVFIHFIKSYAERNPSSYLYDL